MRLLVRTAVVVAAAGGFMLAVALSASADVVEPSSAYQPASAELFANGAPQEAETLPAEETVAPEPVGETSPSVAETRDEPVATPAPEPQVRPVPAHIKRTEPAPQVSGLATLVRPFSAGLERIGSYLGRVVSACQVAAGSGAGVPVLALAVLSVVAALDRRRVFGTRTTTDEDVPELLYATEVIAPG